MTSLDRSIVDRAKLLQQTLGYTDMQDANSAISANENTANSSKDAKDATEELRQVASKSDPSSRSSKVAADVSSNTEHYKLVHPLQQKNTTQQTQEFGQNFILNSGEIRVNDTRTSDMGQNTQPLPFRKRSVTAPTTSHSHSTTDISQLSQLAPLSQDAHQQFLIQQHASQNATTANDAYPNSTTSSISSSFEEGPGLIGFGVSFASRKRNNEFHSLFPKLPQDELLIEDYACAFQESILLQGRMYISEKHVCFHSNVFGYVRELVIPLHSIKTVERKNIALVIPNSIEFTTHNGLKYFFASFLFREDAYTLIQRLLRSHYSPPASDSSMYDMPDLLLSSDSPPTTNDNTLESSKSKRSRRKQRKWSHVESEDEANMSGNEKSVQGQTKTRDRSFSALFKLRGLNHDTDSNSNHSNGNDSTHSDESKSNSNLRPPTMNTSEGSTGLNSGMLSPATPSQAEDSPIDIEVDDVPEYDVCNCETTHHTKMTTISNVCIEGPRANVVYFWKRFFNMCNPQSGQLQFVKEVRGFTNIKCEPWKPPEPEHQEQKSENGTPRKGWSHNMEYLVPLNAPIGPKSVPTFMTVTIDHFSRRTICLRSVSQAPTVPNGSSFKTVVLVTIREEEKNRVRVIVSVSVEWLKSSFLKSVIERSVLDQMRTHYSQMNTALKRIVKGHRATPSAAQRRRKHQKQGSDVDKLNRHNIGSSGVNGHHKSLSGLVGSSNNMLSEPQSTRNGIPMSTVVVGVVVILMMIANVWIMIKLRGVLEHVSGLNELITKLVKERDSLLGNNVTSTIPQSMSQ